MKDGRKIKMESSKNRVKKKWRKAGKVERMKINKNGKCK